MLCDSTDGDHERDLSPIDSSLGNVEKTNRFGLVSPFHFDKALQGFEVVDIGVLFGPNGQETDVLLRKKVRFTSEKKKFSEIIEKYGPVAKNGYRFQRIGQADFYRFAVPGQRQITLLTLCAGPGGFESLENFRINQSGEYTWVLVNVEQTVK